MPFRKSSDLPKFHLLELFNSAFVRVDFYGLLHAAERGVLKFTTTHIAMTYMAILPRYTSVARVKRSLLSG